MKPGPSPRAWAAIRKRYERAESVASIARRYHTSRETIKRHARSECWTVNATQAIEQMRQDLTATPREIAGATRAHLIDLAARKTLESPAIASALESLTETLKRQSAFASRLTTIAGQLLDDIEAGRITHSPLASRGALLIEAVSLCSAAQNFCRLAAGLKAGQPNTIEHQKVYGKRFTIVTPQEKRANASQDASENNDDATGVVI